MATRNRLNESDLNRALGMLQSGRTQEDVSRTLRVSQSVISRAWTRYQMTGSVQHRHGGGRPRSTNPAQDRYLVVSASRNRHSNARKLQDELQRASGVHVSDQTVRNRLHDAGMRARRPAIRIPLSVNHRRARREWCQEHLAWDEEDWESVLFTDESKFCLDFTDGRRRVWRRKGERYHDATIEEHDRYGGGSVMVWGGISLSGRTDLHVFRRGSVTAAVYSTGMTFSILLCDLMQVLLAKISFLWTTMRLPIAPTLSGITWSRKVSREWTGLRAHRISIQ